MQKEKVRIFALARELKMESKDLVALCRQHSIDVKNQLSTIEPETRDQIVELVQRGGPAVPPAVAPRAPGAAATIMGKVKNLDARPRSAPAPVSAPPAEREETEVAPSPTSAPPPTPVVVPAAVAPPVPAVPAGTAPPSALPVAKPPAAPVAAAPEVSVAARQPEAPTLPRSPDHSPGSKVPETLAQPRAAEPQAPLAPSAAPAPEQPRPVVPPAPPKAPDVPAAPLAPAAGPTAPTTPPAPSAGSRPPAGPGSGPGSGPPNRGAPPNLGPKPMRQLDNQAPRGDRTPHLGRPGDGPRRPGGGERLPPRAPGSVAPRPNNQTLRPQPNKPAEPPKPPPSIGPRKLGNITAEMLNKGLPITTKEMEDSLKPPPPAGQRAASPGAPVAPEPEVGEDDGVDPKKKAGSKRPGALPGRDARHKERAERQQKRKGDGSDVRGGKVMLLDDEKQRHRKDPRHKRTKQKPTEDRKKDVVLELPITVRSLSEGIGQRSGNVLFKLMDLGALPTININSMVEPEMALLVADAYNTPITIKRALDKEQILVSDAARADKPEDLLPRAPVVTIMGHVDHGKTSLLDQIRRSNVVDTEAGGITQVIRAWRVEHNGKPITFLDTPGHEAFTKMRARGANVTDIAVIVVAANDGVMPQTEEAINHAKAAEVKIVVAINKVDLPDSNLKKTEQQLYGLGLIPDTMGGEVPFVLTSAKTGKGIDDLLEQISIVAELEELKANPNKPAAGTCLEAHLSEQEGVLATLLVQDGTLRPGDIVLCGATYGTVRKMYNDLGKPLEAAGPSVPVRITGLDDVPNADDPFLVVPDVTTAREIADRRKDKAREQGQAPRSAMTLESLKDREVAELKVILKAEAKGSIEAIRAELEKLRHDEVRVRILHAAIGGISVSDVQLALTSPEDTLILGFNVVPDEAAQALADERGIQIKQYNIIYKLAGDIRAALEGKLKPREDVIHLGRAVVRETFRISRVGTIAGCYVTQGTIERSAKVRIIRSGVVVYPPPERSVGLESLKRFKEDSREVREGFECGLKIAGYDDIKVDDVIEAYRIEQVLRTLS